MRPAPIAIIGTGLAGLAAARLLSEAGRPVLLFEKCHDSGGRMVSKRSNAGALDLGAQYFTARDAQFRQQVAEWQARGWVDLWHPVLPGNVDRRASDDSARWVGTPHMGALTRELLGQLPVHFGCRIEQIAGQPGHWTLLDADGNRHGPFAEVILALPAPQASALLASVAVDLAEQATSVPMRATWAVALGFAKPLSVELQARFVRGPVLDWLACNSSKPGRHDSIQNWVLHADSDWSDAHRDLPALEVITRLRDAFEQAIGQPVPEPDVSIAHRWLHARATGERNWGALGNAGDGLIACGDWCLSGRIEGAWLSGREAARRMLQAR